MITLLEGVAGSRAYGLDTPDSDTDLRAIHAAPTRELLGLNPPPEHPDYNRAEAWLQAVREDLLT